MSAIKGKPMQPKVKRTTEIGQRVTDLRMELNMTQRELSKQVGIDRVTIWSIETGKFLPNITHAMALANVLQTTPVYLYTGQGPKWSQSKVVALPWETGRDPRGSIYCPYCGKGNGWTVRQLSIDALPLPTFCNWCGKKVRSD